MAVNKEKVTWVKHWCDKTFSFKTTRDPGFRFANGEFSLIGAGAVVTKDVRIGLKYQARETHIIGNTSDGSTFDLHAKALNPSHQNDKTIILSQPLGEIFLSSNQKFNFSSFLFIKFFIPSFFNNSPFFSEETIGKGFAPAKLHN